MHYKIVNDYESIMINYCFQDYKCEH